MKIKQILTAAMAMAMIAPAAQTVKAERGISVSSQQKEGIVKPVKSARQVIREDAGGMQVISYGYGITPIMYGTYHAKRGTHKRTNK